MGFHARIAVILLIFLPVPAFPAPEGKRAVPKFLVLGFEARELNGIQSRFLREKILWDLQTAGYSIVPVMEFEKFFTGTGEETLRKPGEKTIRRYAEKLEVDYVISGKIYPRGGEKPRGTVNPGTEYACEILIYNRKENRFNGISVAARGRDDYFLFISDLSRGIVKEIMELIGK